VEEFVEGDGFDRALRVQFRDKGLLNRVELLAFAGTDDEVFGGEDRGAPRFGRRGLCLRE
jgi:hypothetical protein